MDYGEPDAPRRSISSFIKGDEIGQSRSQAQSQNLAAIFNTLLQFGLLKLLLSQLSIFAFGGFESFDGDPPPDRKANDAGASFTLGWKF